MSCKLSIFETELVKDSLQAEERLDEMDLKQSSTALLHAELWTSWASLLRSYAAAHGLNSTKHAVVEVGPEEITLRAGSQWILFTHRTMQYSDGRKQAFLLTEQGTVLTAAGQDQHDEEIDLAAERFAREMMHNG